MIDLTRCGFVNLTRYHAIPSIAISLYPDGSLCLEIHRDSGWMYPTTSRVIPVKYPVNGGIKICMNFDKFMHFYLNIKTYFGGIWENITQLVGRQHPETSARS